MTDLPGTREPDREPTPYIHLYGQYSQHEEALITGNEEGLRQLLSATAQALGSGFGELRPFAGDGEGYLIGVRRVTDERLMELSGPYIDQDISYDGDDPWPLDDARSQDAAITGDALNDLLAERIRQIQRFGIQNHRDQDPDVHYGGFSEAVARERCDRAFHEGRGTWAHILAEEMAEAMDAKSDQERRTELIQLAAVAIAWAEAIARRSGAETE